MNHARAEVEPEYLELLRTYAPRPIHTDAELDATIAVLDELLDRAAPTPAEDAFTDLLGVLIENYEQANLHWPSVTGVAALRHLMEENDLTQNDLAALFGSKSIVSEVLSGKRALSKAHVRKLSERFRLPADVFLRD